MSKKMSLMDMKEVRRIINNLIESAVKSNKVISVNKRNGKFEFSSNLVYNGFEEISKEICSKSNELKEIKELQKTILKKQSSFYNKLTERNIAKDVIENGIDLECKNPEDPFGVISITENTIERIIKTYCKNYLEDLEGRLNKFLQNLDQRLFDAYTKGVTADDFIDLIKDDIAKLTEEVNEIEERLKKDGYYSKD